MEKILITGGGTGGHLSVAKSFAIELKKRNLEVFYIGSVYGAEVKWFSDDDLFKERLFLNTGGVVNKKGLKKIISLYNILKATIKAKSFIKKKGISKVVSVGGYSAAAASFGAILNKTELFIHEQNSIIGNLNKLCLMYAKRFYSSYHKISTIKDYPVNEEVFKYQRIRNKLKTIIFLGGSQGAVAINDFAIKLAPKLDKLGINIIHQTGIKDYNRIKQEYKKLNIDVTVFDFTSNLYNYLKKSDFAISRAGASTLWELVANGLPTLFIPYPYAANNHQYYNAFFLTQKKLALIKTQNELDNFKIDEILDLDLKKISLDLIKLTNKDATKKIIDDILT